MSLVDAIETEAADVTLGVHAGLDIEAYHSGPGVSKSGLDLIDQCPAMYYARYLDPDRPAPKERAGQLIGSMTHTAILEPEEFDRRYAPGPDCNRNSRAWMDFEEGCIITGQQAVSRKDYDDALRMAKAARRHPEVAYLLSRGAAEQSAFWRDPATGVLCRCRPDWVHPAGSGDILVDVKTFDSANPRRIGRQIKRKRYDVQDAFYSDGWAKAVGRPVVAFVFVFVETEWPHLTQPVMIAEDDREAGRMKYMENLTTFSSCLESGDWPGYSEKIELIEL